MFQDNGFEARTKRAIREMKRVEDAQREHLRKHPEAAATLARVA